MLINNSLYFLKKVTFLPINKSNTAKDTRKGESTVMFSATAFQCGDVTYLYTLRSRVDGSGF